MINPAELMDIYNSIQFLIERIGEDDDRFAEQLRQTGIPHISFSQISTVEFCQYRYFLQYVERKELDPIPDYFTKGKLLHQMIACSYKKAAGNQPVDPDDLATMMDHRFDANCEQHLRNALAVHLENRWQDCQVIGIEKPFVMMVGPDILPCVGVIDLILKKDGRYILIDHKTGGDFYPDDELQMAIYVEYLRREFGEEECEFYYEHYRWVNNLSRIRKPAFKRVPILLPGVQWGDALERIQHGSRVIDGIREGRRPLRNGECFRCPYRKDCRG